MLFMTEKKVITLSEFKTVVESVESKIKALTEGIGNIQTKIDVGFRSLSEQVAILYEGQTEIKHDLKRKVDRDEFAKLELRVARLENKAA
jgi:hypothetical protein